MIVELLRRRLGLHVLPEVVVHAGAFDDDRLDRLDLGAAADRPHRIVDELLLGWLRRAAAEHTERGDEWQTGSVRSWCAPRNSKRANARRIAARVLLQVIANIPDGAVVVGIDRGLRVVLPAHGRGLRRLAFHEHRFAQRQLAERIAGAPRRKALAREVRRVAKGIADADITGLVHRGTRHPSKTRCLRCLVSGA